VQTTLLGLAIAAILALIAALVGPLMIDWNAYRSTIEAEASRLAGLDVQIDGAIDARLLPSPRLKLGDIVIAAPGSGPFARAAAVEVELGLGPLMRGRIEATELRVMAPRLSIGLTSDGTVAWPVKSLPIETLTVSRLAIRDGRLTLTDGRSGVSTELQKVSFDGDIRSLNGPFRGEGGFVFDGQSLSFRVSGSHGEGEGPLKLRLSVEPSDQPLTAAIDGALGFDNGVPEFDGGLTLLRPAGALLANGERVLSDPWQLTGKIHASPAAAKFEELVLKYGPEERAAEFSGHAAIDFTGKPRLDGSIAAVDIDIDRLMASPDLSHRPPPQLIGDFVAMLVGAVKPPLPVAVGVGIDAITAGGKPVETVRGQVRFDGEAWSVADVSFRAPGLSEIRLSGRLAGTPQNLIFSGPASLDSIDPRMLSAWLAGNSEPAPAPAERLMAHGDLTIAADRFAVDHLQATLGHEAVSGRLAYRAASGNHAAALDGELHAAVLDVDAWIGFVKVATSDDSLAMPRQLALVADIGKANIAGVVARDIGARVKVDAGIVNIERLSVGDLGGATLAMSGRIDELSSRPRGKLTLDLDARALGDLASVGARFVPSAADVLHHIADALISAKLHGVLSVDRAAAGSVAKLDLDGTAGTIRVALQGDAAGEPAKAEAASIHLDGRLDADNGAALIKLIGLDRVVAVDQLPGQLHVVAAGSPGGEWRIESLATAGGFSAAVKGQLRRGDGGVPAGGFELKTTAADLRPLRQIMTGEAGVAVPTSASTVVGIDGRAVTLSDVTLSAGKTALRGRLDLTLGKPLHVDGALASDAIDAAQFAALVAGLPTIAPAAASQPSGPWSAATVGAGAFAMFDGAVRLTFDRAALTPGLTARDLKSNLKFHDSRIEFGDIDGTLGGGRLNGELSFDRDPENLSARGHLRLADAQAAAVLPVGRAVDGKLTLDLSADALARTPAALIAALHGGGDITLTDTHVAGLDPAAFDAAARAADRASTIDTAKILAAVDAAIDRGRLTLPKATVPVTIAAGRIRFADAELPVQSGARLALDGVIDLNAGAVDGRATLIGAPPLQTFVASPPELAVAIKGPLAAPKATLDASALIGWLTLRATELQTRRLESIEANRREDASPAPPRPASPSLRVIPQGTATEAPFAAAAPASQAAHGFDRLVPEPAAGSHSGSRIIPAVRADKGQADNVQADNAQSTTATTAPEPRPLHPATRNERAATDADKAAGVPADGDRRRPQAAAPAQPASRGLLDLLFRP
jgi:large subunit ribosomal protein L24